jgi:tetratricopeptide (TPR) repeat protein
VTDPQNVVVQLCVQGMQAEAEGRDVRAQELFLQAWEAAVDDYDACIAAHYLARHQPTPQETLRWNQECLTRADKVGDDRVRGFYASLHGNMARAHRDLGQIEQAREHFESAAKHIDDVPAGPHQQWLRYRIAAGLRATARSAPQQHEGPVGELLAKLCARTDLEALSLLLPPYMGSLGTPEDEELITTALRMLHAERRLPDEEQTALSHAIKVRSAV